MVDRIGYFDEENFALGCGAEDDFSLRAGAAGYLCALAMEAYVYRAESTSFNTERRSALLEASQKALCHKHPGRFKAAIAMLKAHPELMRFRQRIIEQLHETKPASDLHGRSPA